MRKQKKAPAKAKVYPRKRAAPVQIYLSDTEKEAIQAIARKRDINMSELCRFWIRRAMPKKPKRRARDQRQLELCE